MIEGLVNREGYNPGRQGAGECARARYIYLAVSQPPSHIAHHVPIPPHITSAQTRRAEPLYFCRVIQGRSPRRIKAGRNPVREKKGDSTEATGKRATVFFDGTLKVGLCGNVRFGSFATEPFRASAEQCPLCLR
jgi:hypothetical protein